MQSISKCQYHILSVNLVKHFVYSNLTQRYISCSCFNMFILVDELEYLCFPLNGSLRLVYLEKLVFPNHILMVTSHKFQMHLMVGAFAAHNSLDEKVHMTHIYLWAKWRVWNKLEWYTLRGSFVLHCQKTTHLAKRCMYEICLNPQFDR